MEVNELNMLLHCMRYYYDEEFKNHLGLLEYYSITDLKPSELAIIARKLKKFSLSAHLLDFDNKTFYGQFKTKEDVVINCTYAINDKFFTSEDKLNVIKKLKEEGYPLVDGVYYAALRRYATHGIDEISKENVRKKLMNFYHKSTGIECNLENNITEKYKKLIK